MENDVEFADLLVKERRQSHISIVLVENFHVVLDELQRHELVLILVDRDDEVQRSESRSKGQDEGSTS